MFHVRVVEVISNQGIAQIFHMDTDLMGAAGFQLKGDQAVPIFFFYQFLKGISTAFLDAARVDGCTEIGIFVKIILPLMAPAFASMGIYQGMISWNNFLWPLIVLKSNSKMTLPIGLSTLMTPYGNNYDILLAGSVMAIIPVLILFLAFQKYFIAGMTAGGVKG